MITKFVFNLFNFIVDDFYRVTWWGKWMFHLDLYLLSPFWFWLWSKISLIEKIDTILIIIQFLRM